MTARLPRFERFELPDLGRLSVLSSPKLKTLLVRVFFAADLDEDVTRRALLPSVLERGTARLPTLQAIERRSDDLWGARTSAGVAKIGEWHIARFGLSVVNERYLSASSGAFRGGLELLRDLIFDPRLEGGVFDASYVEGEKENLRRSIESLIDEKPAWAKFRAVERMCAGEPFRLYQQGRVEDLASIDAAGLAEFWRELTTSAPLSIYVAGDIEASAARDLVAGVFRVPRGKVRQVAPVPPRVPVGAPREFREKLEVQQARLVIGFRHGITYASPRYETMAVLSGVLGGYSHSKLFQNVREKASLAYSAYSRVERNKGLLFITAGTASEKLEKARDICLRQVEDLRAGAISDEELDATRRTMLSASEMLEDELGELVEIDYLRRLHGQELDLEGFRERVAAVTREEIARLAAELEHDITYFLHS